jgi:hypothetical protein
MPCFIQIAYTYGIGSHNPGYLAAEPWVNPSVSYSLPHGAVAASSVGVKLAVNAKTKALGDFHNNGLPFV